MPEWPACMSSRRTNWYVSGSTSTSLTSCANSACYRCESLKCRAKEIVRRVLSLCSAKPRRNWTGIHDSGKDYSKLGKWITNIKADGPLLVIAELISSIFSQNIADEMSHKNPSIL